MAAYAQRTDLNSSAMTPEYGGIKKLADAQKAVPMGASPAAAPQIQRPVPGAAGSLTRPTERPLEPVTFVPAKDPALCASAHREQRFLQW